MLSRREFLATTAAVAALRPSLASQPAVISTWVFGKAANADA